MLDFRVTLCRSNRVFFRFVVFFFAYSAQQMFWKRGKKVSG